MTNTNENAGIASLPQANSLKVNDLYTQLLGREADPEGLAYWQNAFGTGDVTSDQQNNFLQAVQSYLSDKTEAEKLALAPKLFQQAATTANTATGITSLAPKTEVATPATQGGIGELTSVADKQVASAPATQTATAVKPATTAQATQAGTTTTVADKQVAAAPVTQAAAAVKPAAIAPATQAGTVAGVADKQVEAAPAAFTVEDLYTQILGRAPDAEGLAFWKKAFGDSVDEAEKQSFLQATKEELAKKTAAEQQALVPNLPKLSDTLDKLPAKPAEPALTPEQAKSKLVEQILGQNLTGKWQGEGFGSAQANAEDMAKIMASIGITDIKQFGEITKTIPGYSYETEQGTVDVPEQTVKTYGNKLTGQEVPITYGERQSDNAWGGTFAGSGNTGYRVQFDAQGNPYFYTTGASSNDLANIMQDLGPIGNIALAVATGGLSIPEQIAANLAVSVLSGKDIGDAIKSAAISFAGSKIPGLDAVKDSTSFISGLGLSPEITKTITNAVQNAAVSGGTALLSGQNVGEAMLKGAATGGVNGAINSMLSGPEFLGLTDNQKKLAANAATGIISGKPLDQVLINSAIAAAKSAIKEDTAKDTTAVLKNAGLKETQPSITDIINDQLTIDASGARDVNAAAEFAKEQGYDKFKFDGKTYNIDNNNAENTIAQLEAAALKENTEQNLAGGEFAGVDKAIADAAKRNNVEIGNAEADTVEEAAALAKLRNPTGSQFTYGGQTYNMTASDAQVRNAALQADLAEAKTPTEAKAAALKALGPNTQFTWTDPDGKEQTLVTSTTKTTTTTTSPTYQTNTAVANAVSNKLAQNLSSAELNPADLTKAEMAKYVNIYSTATEAQRAALLKGSDSSTFKVIDTLFKDTQRLNPTGAISDLDKPYAPNQSAAETARLARLASVSPDATGAVGALAKNIYTPNTADVTTRLTEAANNTATPVVPEGDTTGLKAYNKSFLDTATDVVKAAGNVVGADAAGLGVRGAQFLGDLMGQDTDSFAKVQNLLANDKDKSMSKLIGNEKVIAGGIASGIESAVSWTLGGPLASVASVAGIVANNSWVEGAQAGLTPEENAKRTATMTALEVTGEMLGIPGMKAIMKGIPVTGSVSAITNALVKTGSGLINENASELLTTVAQFSADKFASFGLSKNATFEDFQTALKDTIIATTAAVGSSGGIATAVRAATDARSSDISDADRSDSGLDLSLLTKGSAFGAKVGDTSNQGLNPVTSEAIDFNTLNNSEQSTILSNLRSTLANVTLAASLSIGSVASANDVESYVSTNIEQAVNNGSNITNTISSSVNSSINAAINNNVSSTSAINSAVSSSITTAINNNVNPTAAINSSVNSAVKSAVNNNVSTTTAINSSITTAINTAVNNNVSPTTAVTTAVNSAVTSAITTNTSNNTLTDTTVKSVVNTAVNSAVETAVKNNVSTQDAVDTAVTAAVQAAVQNNVSTTAAVQAAVAAVTNLNVNIQAVTALATNVATQTAIAVQTPTQVTTPSTSKPTGISNPETIVTPVTPVTPTTPVVPATPETPETPPDLPPDVLPPEPPPEPPTTPITPVVKPPVVKPPQSPRTVTPSFEWPQAQAIAATFGIPQLANVFYYGKDFGSKKQKLDKSGQVVEEEYKPLSVTKAGAEGELIEEQEIAEEKKNRENNADDAVDLILGESSDSMSIDDILNIVKGA